MEFLNKEGVQTLWSKVKDKVQSINKEFVGLNNVTNDAQVKRSEMGAANGVPTLDSNGKIPVDQLGNLDTVVAMVVTQLPTTDIKTNKIYLVKDNTTEGDLYQEYLYIDGKWEKVGTHKQEVDLTDYAKKSEALKSVESTLTGDLVQLNMITVSGMQSDVNITKATRQLAGVMSAVDKNKLDGIADGANNYTLPIASATALGGIKLGSGLSVTNDGTVSVSADVVAGAVQWDSIENKPNVAILDGNNEFVSDDGNIRTIISGNEFSVCHRVNPTQNMWNEVLTTGSNYISTNGIKVFGGGDSNHAFTTNGRTFDLSTLVSTSDIQSISTDELNEILV